MGLNLKILYYNCQGMANDRRLYKLKRALGKIKWDMVDLSKIKRDDENLIRRHNGNYLNHYG